MKRILLLSLLLLPIVALAQYPTFSNKQKLGVQTTGDGLIYRGNNNPNYNPSNINNAYFYLDTIASKLYLYSVGTWQQVYPTASDTTSLGAYLLKSDTLAMLLPYLRKSDTISLSNRINNKLNATDTVSLSNRINLKLNKTDTINLSNRIDLKLNKSDTISLSNRIDIKLNASDTVSLSNRINKKLDTLYVNYQTNVDLLTNKDTINITPLEAGAGINITNNVISLDTTLLDSVVRVQNVYVKNGTGTVLNKGEAVYVTGADGTNIIVGRASNVAESSSSKTLGLTMTSIAINGFGYVIKEGLLEGLNTSAANSDGDPIWLSNIPGGLIFGLANKPYAPNHLVYLGVVTRKQQNNGEVYVTVQNGFEIKELHDVQIIDPVNKASLYYNSSQSLWRDTTAALLVIDTTIMLSKYVNTYSNQTGINGDKTFNNVINIDSATVTGKLLVNTNISDAVKINSNTNSTNLELMNSNGTVSIKSSNKNMILQTDTTALVYLNGDNKKVGILTMNPQQELEVNGNARITGLNNNLVPTRMIGSDNNGDLTNVNLGQGLSFANDTLKVDLTIIDTAIAASSITLAGHVTGTGSTNSTVNTTISNNVVTNDMLAGSISDTKLNTITTAGKVSNSATTATSTNTNSAIVTRDGSGNFSAGTITASLNGNASTATNVAYSGLTGAVPIWNQNTTGNAATVTSVLPSNFASQTANTVLAAPNGSSGTPTFRLLTSTDIPSLNYLPLTGGTTSGLITSSFTNTTNYSTSATDNNAFTIYNNTTSSNNIYGGLQFLIGQNSGAIPGGPGLAQIYAIRAGSASNPSTDLTFSTKSNVSGVLEKMRIKFDGKVGIGTTAPSYLLDVNGQIGSTGFIKSGGLSTQFLKADGSVDANTYLTSGTAAYLPLAGGTLSGNLYGINQGLSTNLTISDIIPGNSSPLFTTITTGPSSSETVRFGLNQSLSGGANMFMGGTQGLGGNPTNPNIFFTDSRKAYASIGGIHTSSGTNNQSGHIVFSTTPSVNTIALTERMRIAQDGAITMNNTLGVTGATTLSSTLGVTGATTLNNILTINSGANTNSLNINNTALNNSLSMYSTNNSSFTRSEYKNGLTGNTASDGLNVGYYNGGYFVNYENTKSYLYTNNNTNQLVLDTDGNVGIGIDDATAKLDVSGTLKVSGTTTLSNLGTNGTRMVVTDNNGVLSTQAIPSSGSGTVTNVSANPSTPNGLSVATNTTTPVISMALAANGITGVVSNTTQEFSGNKTFLNNINGSSALNVTGLSALNGGASLGTLATTSTLTRVLGINSSNVIGELSLGGGMSVGSGVLSIQAATGSQTGTVIHFGNQVFGGNKTFNGTVDISSTLTVGSTGTFGGRVKTLWLERSYANSTATSSTVSANITWLNIHQDAAVTLTLPDAATYPGKELIIKQTGAGIVSSSGAANIIGFTTRYDIGSPQNVIINPSTYRFATLVSDGTYWIIMQVN